MANRRLGRKSRYIRQHKMCRRRLSRSRRQDASGKKKVSSARPSTDKNLIDVRNYAATIQCGVCAAHGVHPEHRIADGSRSVQDNLRLPVLNKSFAASMLKVHDCDQTLNDARKKKQFVARSNYSIHGLVRLARTETHLLRYTTYDQPRNMIQ